MKESLNNNKIKKEERRKDGNFAKSEGGTGKRSGTRFWPSYETQTERKKRRRRTRL